MIFLELSWTKDDHFKRPTKFCPRCITKGNGSGRACRDAQSALSARYCAEHKPPSNMAMFQCFFADFWILADDLLRMRFEIPKNATSTHQIRWTDQMKPAHICPLATRRWNLHQSVSKQRFWMWRPPCVTGWQWFLLLPVDLEHVSENKSDWWHVFRKIFVEVASWNSWLKLCKLTLEWDLDGACKWWERVKVARLSSCLIEYIWGGDWVSVQHTVQPLFPEWEHDGPGNQNSAVFPGGRTTWKLAVLFAPILHLMMIYEDAPRPRMPVSRRIITFWPQGFLKKLPISHDWGWAIHTGFPLRCIPKRWEWWERMDRARADSTLVGRDD